MKEPGKYIRKQIATALASITYNSVAVPFYDHPTDDSNTTHHIFVSNYSAQQNHVKDANLYQVSVSLTVSTFFDTPNIAQQLIADTIADSVLTALATDLDLSPDFDNIVQLFNASFDAKGKRGKMVEYAKVLQYEFTVEEL